MSDSGVQERLGYLKRVWAGEEPAEPSWLAQGVAIEGDFAGIQTYVLRPVPGARGAAKRLRARSFRVAETTKQIAESVCSEFKVLNPFYVAGGRFLTCVPFDEKWEQKLAGLQAQIDRDLFQRFGGEVAFHLAGAKFEGGTVPTEQLFEQHRRRRARPLEHVLLSEGGWREDQFFAAAGAGWGKCPACLRTASRFHRVEDQEICEDCFSDTELGTRLSHWRFDPGKGPRIGRDEVVHYFPRVGGEPASFEDLVKQSAGKQWLGHLRIDADHIGRTFRALEGNPSRIWGLSQMLHTFFCQRLQQIVERTYTSIYPVYGGGDDLYVIGPWDQVLGLAVKLSEEFRKLTADNPLAFSAGVSLSKPHQHILTKSDEAAEALRRAKDQGRNRICALGSVTDWTEFRKILRRAGDVLRWYGAGILPDALAGGVAPSASRRHFRSAFLQDILQLSQAKGDVERGQWKPLLHHQFKRNVRHPDLYCEQWVESLLAGGDEWRRAPAVVRYVLLAAPRPAD